MIRSMTAFARSEHASDIGSVAVEVRTVNSRHLDAMVRITSPFQALESRIKALVAQAVERGRVELSIAVRPQAEQAAPVALDPARARAQHAALTDLKNLLGLPDPITLAQVAAAPGVIVATDTTPDIEAFWPMVSGCVTDAMGQVQDMRSREGAFLADDMRGRLDAIAALTQSVQAEAAALPALYRDRLVERIADLTRDTVTPDPARLAQEVAFLADRSDISEELVRADSHMKQFRAVMADAAPGGRKLNFLLQEMNREYSTMGAKIGKAEAAHAIVAIKSELEKLREQVQNVE